MEKEFKIAQEIAQEIRRLVETLQKALSQSAIIMLFKPKRNGWSLV